MTDDNALLSIDSRRLLNGVRYTTVDYRNPRIGNDVNVSITNTTDESNIDNDIEEIREPYVLESIEGPHLSTYSSVHSVITPLLRQIDPSADQSSSSSSSSPLGSSAGGVGKSF